LVKRFAQEIRRRSVAELGVTPRHYCGYQTGPTRNWKNGAIAIGVKAKWQADFQALNCSEDEVVGMVRGFRLWVFNLLFPDGGPIVPSMER
jgi:hypothetical protein